MAPRRKVGKKDAAAAPVDAQETPSPALTEGPGGAGGGGSGAGPRVMTRRRSGAGAGPTALDSDGPSHKKPRRAKGLAPHGGTTSAANLQAMPEVLEEGREAGLLPLSPDAPSRRTSDALMEACVKVFCVHRWAQGAGCWGGGQRGGVKRGLLPPVLRPPLLRRCLECRIAVPNHLQQTACYSVMLCRVLMLPATPPVVACRPAASPTSACPGSASGSTAAAAAASSSAAGGY